MRPVAAGETPTISGQANVSYKRRVVVRRVPQRGVMEILYARSLHERGEVLVTDDRLVVDHVQSEGFARTSARHFHNGRSIAGFIADDMGRSARLLRGPAALMKAPVAFLRMVRIVLQKRRLLGRLLASAPLIAWLNACHASGAFVGYMAGPGDSPERLP